MASIRKRGTKYQAQVRINGTSSSRSFATMREAKSWALNAEAEAVARQANHKLYRPKNFAEVLEKYLRDVTPLKRNTTFEDAVIPKLMECDWAKTPMNKLSSHQLVVYRDQRLRKVKASSLHRQFCIIKHAARIAVDEWDWDIPNNIFQRIKIKKNPPNPITRLNDEVVSSLLIAAEECRQGEMRSLIILGVETCMRRGEMLSLQWSQVDLKKGLVRLCQTKNGHFRDIPLTPLAALVFEGLRRSSDGRETVFSLTPNAVRLSFQRIRRKAKADGVCFHHLRHEGVSRLFEAGFSPPEVASISGHKSMSQLMRYSHARLDKVCAKMSSMSLIGTIQP